MLLDDFYQQTFHGPVVPPEAEEYSPARPSAHKGNRRPRRRR